MPHKDPEARRAYASKYYYGNLEKSRASRRKSGQKAYHANMQRDPGVKRFVCNTCAEEKDACEFPPRGKKCKACNNAYLVQWRLENQEKFHTACKDYRQRNLAACRARSRQYYVEHKQESLAYQVEYRDKNRERNQARDRAYDAKNRVERYAKYTAWRKAHYDVFKASQDAYKARKRNVAVNDFTAQQWHDLQEACDHRCYYCGKRSKGRLTKDHIVPLSKGGNHTLSNIIPACNKCNSTKRDNAPPTPVQPFFLL